MQCSCLLPSRLAPTAWLEEDEGGIGPGYPAVRVALRQQRMMWGQMKALAMPGAEHRGAMPLGEQFSYFLDLGKKPFFLLHTVLASCLEESQPPVFQWDCQRAEVVAAGEVLHAVDADGCKAGWKDRGLPGKDVETKREERRRKKASFSVSGGGEVLSKGLVHSSA